MVTKIIVLRDVDSLDKTLLRGKKMKNSVLVYKTIFWSPTANIIFKNEEFS